MIKKLKVVWVCHFSNAQIRQFLPLSIKRTYYDFAPWISILIREFEKREDIDLHIVSPHMGLKHLTCRFKCNGVSYYFFKPDLPFVHRLWPSFLPLDVLSGFIKNRLIVTYFIRKIKPEIINLHGAENSYYSSTILKIRRIPIYVCIQGIYSNPERFNEVNRPDKHKIKIERQIHKDFSYFGIFPTFFRDLIQRDNPSPIFLKQSYIPNIEIKRQEENEKIYDFGYFGRVTNVKGIDKILEAIAIIKRKKKDVIFNIIGACPHLYKEFLNHKIAELDISENVIFAGYLPTTEEVHRMAVKARVTVISSKFENLPGTIIESVFLGVPITATNVGGIPILNKKGETILLSDYGDIQQLADNMWLLLNSPDYAQTLTKKCREFIIKEFDPNKITTRYVNQYYAIINHFKNGEQIPFELLYEGKGFLE